MRPRGSPLPSSLGDASESPVGGGRGGHRSMLSSWRRRRSPSYYSRAGRRGHPGRAAPRERPHAAAWPRRVRTAPAWGPEARGQG